MPAQRATLSSAPAAMTPSQTHPQHGDRNLHTLHLVSPDTLSEKPPSKSMSTIPKTISTATSTITSAASNTATATTVPHAGNGLKRHNSDDNSLHTSPFKNVDADEAERELANVELAFLYPFERTEQNVSPSGCEEGTNPCLLERLGDAYVDRVYGHRMDNLRRALLAFRSALRSLTAGSRHAVRLCAKLSSVLARTALLERRPRPSPPPYDPASVVALTQILPLPPHARTLPPPLVDVREPSSSSPLHAFPGSIDVVLTSHPDEEDEEYDTPDANLDSVRNSPNQTVASVVLPKVLIPCIQGWTSADGRSGSFALAEGETTAAALSTGEYSLSMYADSPHWCKNLPDAQAYLDMRALHGVLYDILHKKSIDIVHAHGPVTRGARGTPPSDVDQRSNTLLALCLNALEPVLINPSTHSRHHQSSKPIFTSFAHVPSHSQAPNIAGLRAVIATEYRLTLSANPAGADEPASSLVQNGATTALKIARSCGARVPDVDRIRALVSLCRAYVSMHHDAGDVAMTKARDTLALVVHAIPKLREYWSTNIATKNVDCAPVIHLLDDLADDAASLAATVRTSSSSSFSRCTLC